MQQLAGKKWSAELLYARGELYRARGKPGDFAQAAIYYQQSINSDAKLPESWRGLGLALIRDGKKEAGQRALRQYLFKKPDAADKSMIVLMAGGG